MVKWKNFTDFVQVTDAVKRKTLYYNPGHNISTHFDVWQNLKESWLLVINMVYASCLTSCRTT